MSEITEIINVYDSDDISTKEQHRQTALLLAKRVEQLEKAVAHLKTEAAKWKSKCREAKDDAAIGRWYKNQQTKSSPTVAPWHGTIPPTDAPDPSPLNPSPPFANPYRGPWCGTSTGAMIPSVAYDQAAL